MAFLQQTYPFLFSKQFKLVARVHFSCIQLNYQLAQLIHSETDLDSNVSSISNSFRRGWNWDVISRKFDSFELNDSVVERVLLELKEPGDAKSALSFFHWSTKSKNIEHGVRSYCVAIHILVRARLLTDARALLESVLKKNSEHSLGFLVVDSLLSSYKICASHPLVFDLLIQAYAKLRMSDIAFDVCLYVEEHGFSVSVISYNTLLHVIQKSDQCNLVWDIYEHMIQKRIYPNEITVRIMINALCKEGKLHKAVDTLDKIMKKRSTPSVIVNFTLIFGVLEDGRIEESVTMLKRLLQKNMIPDSVAYSLLVCAKVKVESYDSTRELYEEMLKRGFLANSFVYTSFVGACCDVGRIDEAYNLMQEMEERGLKPYGETFDHLIKGCAEIGRLGECLSNCEKMLRIGFVPSCLTFNKVVEKLCESGGNVDHANDILTILLDEGFLPNNITYSYLIEGYAKKDKIQEALKLYYEMEYKSLSLGLSVFRSLIQSLCRCGKLEDAEKLFRIMKDRLITPDSSIYKTLIASYLQKGDTAKALCLQNDMASLGL